MSESKEPEGTPVAQGSTEQQGTQTTPTPSPPPELGADAPQGPASAMEQALTAAMQPVVTAIAGATTAMTEATKAEEDALKAVQPAVKAMAAAVIAGGARGTIEQSARQTLQPVSDAMREAQAAHEKALEAMGPAVEMQKALAGMPGIRTALEDVVAAEMKALTAMEGAMADVPAPDGARDVAPSGDGRLSDAPSGDGYERDTPAGTGGEFFDQLKGVPIDYLIATPLISAARANLALASVMTEFINEIGYVVDKDGKTKTRLLEFDLTRPVKNNLTQKLDYNTITVKAPLLAVVPLPALLIDSVLVDLTVEILQATHQKTTHNAVTSLTVGGRYGVVTAQFTGGYSLNQENTRDTNQTAKYRVTVNARQQPLPEGMSKLMDVFASTIQPLESPTVQ